MRDAVTEFLNYNRPFAERNPDLYRVKIARMAENPFAFLRGSFHLFAKDVIDNVAESVGLLASDGGVEMDLVGDIHSENYGTYQATDTDVYYDINDFDETIRGRLDFDVCRLAVSLLLMSQNRGDSLADTVRVTLTGITTYTEALPNFLKKGKESTIGEKSPSGCPPVDDLVKTAAATKRAEFILRLTEIADGHRRLVRSTHYFNLKDSEREQALRLLQDYITRMPKPSNPDFYKVEDVCGRVAGIGSMGRYRYAVLIGGKGIKEGRNVILEFKESRPSAYDIYRQREVGPNAFVKRAEEVVTRQRLLQGTTSPYLGYAVDGAMSFQAREIGPHDLRVDLQGVKNTALLEKVAVVQGNLLARAHARSAARAVGLADPLGIMRDPAVFCQRVLAFALGYGDLVRQDWKRFVGHREEIEKV